MGRRTRPGLQSPLTRSVVNVELTSGANREVLFTQDMLRIIQTTSPRERSISNAKSVSKPKGYILGVIQRPKPVVEGFQTHSQLLPGDPRTQRHVIIVKNLDTKTQISSFRFRLSSVPGFADTSGFDKRSILYTIEDNSVLGSDCSGICGSASVAPKLEVPVCVVLLGMLEKTSGIPPSGAADGGLATPAGAGARGTCKVACISDNTVPCMVTGCIGLASLGGLGLQF